MLKHVRMSLLLLGYMLSSSVLAIGPGGSARASRNGARFCRWTLQLLGVDVSVKGKAEPALLVANHLSYLDILTLLALHGCRFVTFTEMGESAGIGLITKVSQAFYVNRSKPSLVRRDIEKFEKELKRGVQFAFFPEGSSFDGSFLRPFKSSLFESAIRTNTNIQPVCLRYVSLDNEPITLKNRDRVFYHGDMQLIPQLLGILKIKRLRVELVYGPVIETKGRTRKEVANLAHQEIAKHFLPVVL